MLPRLFGAITEVGYHNEFVMVFNIASDLETLTIPCQNVGVFDAVIKWGDGSSSTITAYNDADLAHEYATAGEYTVEITGTFPNIFFNNGGDKLKLIGILNWGNTGFTRLVAAFFGCSNLISATSNFSNTSLVNTMERMFRNCTSLTTLDVSGFNTSLVTNMEQMFYGCISVTTLDVSGFNTALVTNMSYMFYNCPSLTTLDVSGFNTALVTTMEQMFRNCTSVTTLDVSGFDTSLVNTMEQMFRNCISVTTLDVSGFNTALVTTMAWMFYRCESATTLDVSGFNTALVTTMERMFYNCTSLTTLDVDSFSIGLVSNFTLFINGFSLPTSKYDATLIAWDAQNPVDGLTVDFGGSQYTSGGAAEAARQSLISTDSWTINDGGAA